MKRGPDMVPLSWGKWQCMECGTDGIGGLTAFYVHWMQAHHVETQPEKQPRRAAR